MQASELQEKQPWCMSVHDAMQGKMIKKRNMTGNHLSSKHRKQAQKAKWVGATPWEFIQFVIAKSVSYKKYY